MLFAILFQRTARSNVHAVLKSTLSTRHSLSLSNYAKISIFIRFSESLYHHVGTRQDYYCEDLTCFEALKLGLCVSPSTYDTRSTSAKFCSRRSSSIATSESEFLLSLLSSESELAQQQRQLGVQLFVSTFQTRKLRCCKPSTA